MNKIAKKIVLFCITIACFASIYWQETNPARTTPKISNLVIVNASEEIDFERHFQQLGVEGSILIYDAQSARSYQYNKQRNKKAFLPASTFKILNSLISIETGIIDDEIAILTWDGISRSIPEWNQDLNMRQAFKFSAVWFYQVLARKVGYEKMQTLVKKSNYGNQNIGSKEDIDTFWLTGELRITPQEQIQFLRRLHDNDLPFSERSLSIVKDIAIVEKTPNYTIRAKTGALGLGDETQQPIGWYVGYLEKGKDVYFFATNIDLRDDSDLALRSDLTRRCLKDLQLP